MRLLSASIALLGLGIFVLIGVMMTVGPEPGPLPEGFRTTILALEFARTDADLFYIAEPFEGAASTRMQIAAVQSWDTLFPVVYGLFITLIGFQLIRDRRILGWIAVLCGLLILPTDLHENRLIADILQALARGESASDGLAGLYLATWLKWGAIGLAMGAIGLTLTINGSRGVGLTALACFAVYAACFFSGSKPALVELMSLATGIFFIVFTVRAAIQAARGTPQVQP